MAQDRLQKLLEVASDRDKARLTLARNRSVLLKKALDAEKTAKGCDELERAIQKEDDLVAKLWPAYFPPETGRKEQERFHNRKKALEWAHAWERERGFKAVSQGKFYPDMEKCGALHPDGSVSRYAVLNYLLEHHGEAPKQAETDMDIRKRTADTEKAEADARIAKIRSIDAEREHDGKWLLREEAEDNWAVMVGMLKDIFRHRVYLDHSTLLSVCGGDVSREPEFSHALQSFVDNSFNDFARYREIDVEIEEEEGEA